MGFRRRDGDQPLPKPNDGPSMHDLVAADVRARFAERGETLAALFEARKQLGLERYGSLLQAGNGRDWLRDLREELADAAVYAMQGMQEITTARVPGYARAVHAYICAITALEGLSGLDDGSPS